MQNVVLNIVFCCERRLFHTFFVFNFPSVIALANLIIVSSGSCHIFAVHCACVRLPLIWGCDPKSDRDVRLIVPLVI